MLKVASNSLTSLVPTQKDLHIICEKLIQRQLLSDDVSEINQMPTNNSSKQVGKHTFISAIHMTNTIHSFYSINEYSSQNTSYWKLSIYQYRQTCTNFQYSTAEKCNFFLRHFPHLTIWCESPLDFISFTEESLLFLMPTISAEALEYSTHLISQYFTGVYF